MRATVRRTRTGFTLIETIAAIVLLTVAIPPMIWSISEAESQRADAILTSRARWLAVSKLEDVIADRHSTTRGYAYLVTGNYGAEASITGYPGFTRTVAFNETTADLTTAGSGYMTVTVSVSWTGGSGDARTMPVSAVLTDYTP